MWKYSNINLQIHTNMGVIYTDIHAFMHQISLFSPTSFQDIYRAKRYSKNNWHFLGFLLKELNSSNCMLVLCSTCQFTNDSVSRSWKARPQWFQSSKAAKLIRILHNVRSDMNTYLSDMFNFYPVVYLVTS